jgi:hypothetical protein
MPQLCQAIEAWDVASAGRGSADVDPPPHERRSGRRATEITEDFRIVEPYGQSTRRLLMGGP